MSGKLAVQVYELELTPAERDILLAMALNACDDGGDCRPGVRLLAWRTGYTDRHVQRTIRSLETKHILVVVDRPQNKPIVYRIALSAGANKKPFEPRKPRVSGDTIVSPLTDVTGDIQIAPDRMQSGDTQMSPHEMSPVTWHGNEENVTGDMASANLLRIRPKDERPLNDQERNAPARDSTPMPFHIANGFWRPKPNEPTPIIRAIEASPVYQAYVRGWDGITPVLSKNVAQLTHDAVRILEGDVENGETTFAEIEAVTRWKRGDPRTRDYPVGFVKVDTQSYRAWKRAQEKTNTNGAHPARAAPAVNGKPMAAPTSEGVIGMKARLKAEQAAKERK